MLPQIENIQKSENESFYVGEYKNKWFDRTWHYHSEFELLLIKKGHGVRVVGNSRMAFEEGDLVLVGGNIPHAWFSDPVYFKEDNDLHCESVYVQFNRSIFGNQFASLPEMKPINNLLDKAKFGLSVTGPLQSDIIEHIESLPERSGLDRLIGLIKILEIFQTENKERIVSSDYFAGSLITKSTRVKEVHDYVMNNYMNDIKVQDIADLVKMNVSSFCRFFKKMTKRTFSQYVKETRIDFAQQLLIVTELPSNQIGFECGFGSVAYFNQCFKSISNMSPLEYRSKYKVA